MPPMAGPATALAPSCPLAATTRRTSSAVTACRHTGPAASPAVLLFAGHASPWPGAPKPVWPRHVPRTLEECSGAASGIRNWGSACSVAVVRCAARVAAGCSSSRRCRLAGVAADDGSGEPLLGRLPGPAQSGTAAIHQTVWSSIEAPAHHGADDESCSMWAAAERSERQFCNRLSIENEAGAICTRGGRHLRLHALRGVQSAGRPPAAEAQRLRPAGRSPPASSHMLGSSCLTMQALDAQGTADRCWKLETAASDAGWHICIPGRRY